ncbi:hypothetical protein SAMN04489760_10143 [Syntrophus gentianae]|uniref:Aminoglycoside phosphotransferase domain-containing protein n=1 Tax=Syntrophus gentianae TaxID=43775 RepID=A0A1H7U9Q7_9BACT|nr:bifunctional aminoglycoside phosphotransferase/ATP-binding protein [Syntrophus gentianae]SEL93428.1 hypothetical protein SAMN04489760_10143 [Syntrophus gentianae]
MTHPHLIAAMSRPAFYPGNPEGVELLQTHISLIFLAGNLVYKVKKAVDFGFLDFTTLEKREFYCREELRLNRRLAPEVYLDVQEIVERPGGELALGGSGRVVDYAVVMKKIPEERMLKKLLVQGDLPLSVMERIADKVADFHSGAETGGRIDEIGGLETIRRNIEENFEQTRAYIDVTIPGRQYAFLRSWALNFMEERANLFRRRVEDHRIRDCHGDLHLEHICLLDPEIVIFDCIEFNERFRYEDAAAEVAFLAMDLDFNGYPEYGRAFVDAYIASSGDEEIRQLLNFYKCYYAYVRGKVVGFKIQDSAVSQAERDEARATAGRYFDLAYSCAGRAERPALILMTGLMGTGKSVLARNLAARLGAEILQMDVLRKELLNISPTDHHFSEFGQGIYSEEVTRRTYAEALNRATEILGRGKPVIIDASYKRREERQKAKSLAERLKADFYVIECRLPEEILKERLDRRLTEAGEASDGRWEIYLAQKGDFDPINELSSGEHLLVNTADTPETCAHEILLKIKGIREETEK